MDLVTQESQNPYSYFTDELTEQVMTALQEKLGYTESQASNLLYAGGLSIYTTQDPDLQAIVDEEVNNPDNYDVVYYSVDYRLSIQHEDETVNEHTATEFIGMIFLIDIDGWARSARIQVILGKEYRGRGYSRDAMPRVMTYGFADEPEGLGLHRIWVAVPEKNTRSYSVYQSLGFVPSGTSRDALWDEANNKYQDLNVLDTLVDEYDPVRAMDAFGMHVITTNPGMEKALLLHQHSTAIRKQALSDTIASQPEAHSDEAQDETTMGDKMKSDSARIAQDNIESENTWPYNSTERNKSKKAWWRRLGHDRMSSRNANDSQQEE